MSNKDKDQYYYTDFDYSKCDDNHIPQVNGDIQNLRNKIREQNNNIQYLKSALETTIYALKNIAPVQYRETIKAIEQELKGKFND